MLCQACFCRAVMAEHRSKAALFNFKTNSAKAFRFISWVGIVQVFNTDYAAHRQSLSHRQVAPQGSTRPESVTGRPSSRLSERPPNFLVNMLSVTYDSTEGDRPVV